MLLVILHTILSAERHFEPTIIRLSISVADKTQIPYTRPFEPYVIYYSFILFFCVTFMLIESSKYAVRFQWYIFLILPM